MAEDAKEDQASGENNSLSSDTKKAEREINKRRRGLLSRVWNGIFRTRAEDFEKRLQHISKEEAAVLARMKRRSQSWRQTARNLIVFSMVFEVRLFGSFQSSKFCNSDGQECIILSNDLCIHSMHRF
uniref:Uncharacterized protein n=1 Tax=Nelumbo nucifera TaxID=4432 RepID=A0A822ZAK3_NELNU|nr:TPA_asm: hypothetical protein HUJ06_001534 [Nelumbo nucifera]